MSPITHLLLGWLVARSTPNLSRSGLAWVTLAGVAPDVDGFGIVAEWATRDTEHPLYWWSEYHHRLGHNAAFGLALTGLAFAATRRVKVAALVAASFHLHLLGDLVGSRGPDGYQWPIPYLWPFSAEPELTVAWQWPLDAWQNVAITLLLLLSTFWVAWAHGSSPLELVSPRANRGFVHALRRRVPRNGA